MRSTRCTLFSVVVLIPAFVFDAGVAQSGSPLRLEKTISLPGVQGRIDHLAYDTVHQRLFVAALGNNTVEVIDPAKASVTKTIAGLAEPQGVLYEPQNNHLWVANGDDGTVRIFDASTFQLLRSIHLGDDADNIRADPTAHLIYVGYGSGGIAVFDPTGKKIKDIKLDAHPESFQIEPNGQRIFVNLPDSQKLAVIDRNKSAAVANWKTDDARSNFPMALDEADHRLFIVCRKPAVLLVLDSNSGTVITKLPTVGDSDDVFYDRKRREIYATGGEGAIVIYRQQDANDYRETGRVETVRGARTSLFVPELDRLFVAARQQGGSPAQIKVYKVVN